MSVGAAALSNLGDAYNRKGENLKAMDSTRRAITLFQQSSEEYFEAIATGQLGQIQVALGNHLDATCCCEQAVAILERLGTGVGLADILITQGHIHRDTGDPTAANQVWRRALAILTTAEDARVAEVRHLLDGPDYAASPVGS